MQIAGSNKNLKPFIKQYKANNEKEKILLPSTASISSNKSQSSYSIKKYSFKTGGVKNINRKQQCQAYQDKPIIKTIYNMKNQEDKIPNEFNMKRNDLGRIHKIQKDKNIYQKSKILKPSFFYQYPESNKPVKLYTGLSQNIRSNKEYAINNKEDQSKAVYTNKINIEKDRIQRKNRQLRRCISQKQIRYIQRFNELNMEINKLKNSYVNKQEQMKKLSQIIREYFG